MSGPPARPAWWRVPLLVFAFVALLAGTGAGLARLGWPMPPVAVQAVGWHGPLMICGFFGVVIALERAVALGERWAYAAPLAGGLGTAALMHGAPALAPWGWLAGALVLCAASLRVLQRQRETFVALIAVAAACQVLGMALWLAGVALHLAMGWWLAFLVLTIAAERLELSRYMPRPRQAGWLFAAVLATMAVGLALRHVEGPAAPGDRLFGAALLGLAAWLARFDIARRTVRTSGLARFVASCLLSGYAWLAVAGAVMFAAGLAPGSAAYDAALHALGLGFVFAMVFGHAPIVFPAVLRVPMAYHAGMYGPLVLLHASLVLRLGGDALGSPALRRWGALLSALALLAFVAGMAVAAWRGRAPARSQAVVHR